MIPWPLSEVKKHRPGGRGRGKQAASSNTKHKHIKTQLAHAVAFPTARRASEMGAGGQPQQVGQVQWPGQLYKQLSWTWTWRRTSLARYGGGRRTKEDARRTAGEDIKVGCTHSPTVHIGLGSGRWSARQTRHCTAAAGRGEPGRLKWPRVGQQRPQASPRTARASSSIEATSSGQEGGRRGGMHAPIVAAQTRGLQAAWMS